MTIIETIKEVEPQSFILGVGALLLVWIGFATIKLLFRKKRNLHNFKALIYDAGIKTHGAYQDIKELEKAFEDIENA